MMMDQMGVLFSAIMLIFYLYLAVRWQYVKRPWCYMFGACGVGIIIAARFFSVGMDPTSGPAIAMRVLNVVGLLIAFDGAFCACYGGKIPVWDRLVPPKGAEQPQPTRQEQQGSAE